MSRYKVHDPPHPCRLIDGLNSVCSRLVNGGQRWPSGKCQMISRPLEFWPGPRAQVDFDRAPVPPPCGLAPDSEYFSIKINALRRTKKPHCRQQGSCSKVSCTTRAKLQRSNASVKSVNEGWLIAIGGWPKMAIGAGGYFQRLSSLGQTSRRFWGRIVIRP